MMHEAVDILSLKKQRKKFLTINYIAIKISIIKLN